MHWDYSAQRSTVDIGDRQVVEHGRIRDLD